MIKVEHLCKSYKTGDIRTEVLKDVNLEVKAGEFIAVMGRSGSGKSTLLNILGGMDSADSGSYLFDGEPVSGMASRQLAQFRNKKIGFVFQSFHLLPEFNVMDNIAVPMGYGGVASRERKARSLELIEQVGLAAKAKRRPSQLSGGEQQRVAIARAIAQKPAVLLADEPTGSLDEENGIRVMELLKKLNDHGLTIILVTHDAKIAGYADKVLHMTDGKLDQG